MPPTLLALACTWAVIAYQFRGRFERPTPLPAIHTPPFDRWQSLKGLAVTGLLMVVFLGPSSLPREGIALAAAGVLLLSRRMASRDMLSLVDWQLLVLFVGLFIVNDAFIRTGAMQEALTVLRERGVDPSHPLSLFFTSALLSNVVSNVPATMLLLPTATHPIAGPTLSLASTFAGNLFIVGSIANVIVVTSARSLGITIDFRTHARTGIPVCLVTLGIAGAWLALLAAL